MAQSSVVLYKGYCPFIKPGSKKIDLTAKSDVEIPPQEYRAIHLECALHPAAGDQMFIGIPYDLSQQGCIANVGMPDAGADYLSIILHNLNLRTCYKVHQGDAVAQAVFVRVNDPCLKQTEPKYGWDPVRYRTPGDRPDHRPGRIPGAPSFFSSLRRRLLPEPTAPPPSYEVAWRGGENPPETVTIRQTNPPASVSWSGNTSSTVTRLAKN